MCHWVFLHTVLPWKSAWPPSHSPSPSTQTCQAVPRPGPVLRGDVPGPTNCPGIQLNVKTAETNQTTLLLFKDKMPPCPSLTQNPRVCISKPDPPGRHKSLFLSKFQKQKQPQVFSAADHGLGVLSQNPRKLRDFSGWAALSIPTPPCLKLSLLSSGKKCSIQMPGSRARCHQSGAL